MSSTSTSQCLQILFALFTSLVRRLLGGFGILYGNLSAQLPSQTVALWLSSGGDVIFALLVGANRSGLAAIMGRSGCFFLFARDWLLLNGLAIWRIREAQYQRWRAIDDSTQSQKEDS